MREPTTILKRICTMRAGGTPPVDDPAMWDEAGTPWVSIGDMTRENVVMKTARSVSPAGVRDKRLPVGQPGTVLFAMYASVGAVGTLGVPATWNQALLGLDPIPGRADARFLRYWLTQMKDRLPYYYRSNTQDNLNADQVAHLPFPVLALDEQVRIANFLDHQVVRLDRAIATRHRQTELVVERRGAGLARLYDWTRDGGRRTRLQHMLAQPPCYGVLVPDLVDEGVPFIRVNDLNRVDAGDDPLVRIPARQSLEYRRTVVAAGDVLTSVVGTLGRSAIVREDQAGCNVARAVCRLQPRVDVDPWFIRAWLETPQFAQAAELATGSGTAQATLNMGDLAKFAISDPSDGTARVAIEARRVLADSELQVRLLQQSADLLAERRQALITAAVTGQMDVTTARGAA